MSPRRSVRARINQPSLGAGVQSSSGSSTTSARAERATRSNPGQEGNFKSETPRSLCSDDAQGGERSTAESRQTKTQHRSHDQRPIKEPQVVEALAEDDDGDEEEVTRCICRRQEYPGLPVPLEEGNRSHKAKDTHLASLLAGIDELSEDVGGLFIQCDVCKVWQHGGCVGIMTDEMSPDNYFCEECRKDLHKIMTGARGQKYSRYLPVYEATIAKASRKSSLNKEPESRSSRETETVVGASGTGAHSAKRRSTMNSRAAEAEEEALRRVIEESKTEGVTTIPGSGTRKGKRGRDGSDEGTPGLKRQKTGSESDSISNHPAVSPTVASDNDATDSKGRTTGSGKKARGVVAQTQREKEARERDKEKEKERADAAGRRKGRLERRRGDESEPPEEPPTSRPAAKSNGNTSKTIKPQTSSKSLSASAILSTTTSHKKNGRPPARRGRVGRNQYTRDRDPLPEKKNDSPRLSDSRDSDDVCNGGNDGHGSSILSNGSKPSKPRYMNPNRTSMNDLRKRAAGILEFISRTQVEMAGERTPTISKDRLPPPPMPTPTPRPGLSRVASVNGASKLSHVTNGDEEDVVKGDASSIALGVLGFKELSSLQMMDVLTRNLVLWQKEHGKWGDKG